MTSAIERAEWAREQEIFLAQAEALKVLYNKDGRPIKPSDMFPPKEGRQPGPGARLKKA